VRNTEGKVRGYGELSRGPAAAAWRRAGLLQNSDADEAPDDISGTGGTATQYLGYFTAHDSRPLEHQP
jgi:hypothetical protein